MDIEKNLNNRPLPFTKLGPDLAKKIQHVSVSSLIHFFPVNTSIACFLGRQLNKGLLKL